MSLQFFHQETSESCVPACLRMVLVYWGIEVEEATLRICCQTNRFGSTFAETAVCVQSYGLIAHTVTAAT